MNKKEIGVYIHIPFCKRKCNYCDFISYTNKSDKIEKYIKCLEQEINKFDFSKYKVSTIYIGGGTPSFIESKYIKQIMNALYNKINIDKNKKEDIEITIEINPGTVNERKLQDYKEVGINRLSIGLQASQDRLLKQLGRIHSFQEFIETYDLSKKLGFENINVDLMLGLPNQTIEDLKESLNKIISLNPNHISIYSLILEEGTKLFNEVENNELKLPDEEIERNMYWYVKNILELNGYNHYEISNFSKKGKESKHNLNCWNQEEYIGFGVAAHSYLNNTRFSNTKNLEEYIDNINNNNFEKNITIEEEQEIADSKNEFMMLGFRKIEGVDISKFKEKYIDNPIFLYREKLDKLVKEGLIEIDLNNIKLTNKGIDFANIVFEEFI